MASGISQSVIRRLPRYYRLLVKKRDGGVERISSQTLGECLNLTGSQIRRDLNNFGGFGHQGFGYDVNILCENISRILGLDSHNGMILVGAGNIGRALVANLPFDSYGFKMQGVFDSDSAVIGTSIGRYTVCSADGMQDFCKKNKPVAAVLCVPDRVAADVTAQLYGVGIRAFWNFTHYNIHTDYPDTVVENVTLVDSLMAFSFLLHNTGTVTEEKND